MKTAGKALASIAWLIFLTAPTYAEGLLLYSSADEQKFLGCIMCGSFNSKSVCNEFGQFGSEFNADSIWNSFGKYGSQFSSESPWNEFASSPPIIVDENGGYYGVFTANKYHSKRSRIEALNSLAEAVAKKPQKLKSFRDVFCD